MKVLRHYDEVELWFAFMFLCGTLLIVTSVIAWRSGRQIGLFLSCSCWFTSFGMWLTYAAETHVWRISATTMLFPVLGVFCLALLYNDIAQKPTKR